MNNEVSLIMKLQDLSFQIWNTLNEIIFYYDIPLGEDTIWFCFVFPNSILQFLCNIFIYFLSSLFFSFFWLKSFANFSYIFFKLCWVRGILWHLQKFLQCIKYTWIHPLHLSPLPSPSMIPGIVLTGIIFAFT
jgi:hypothetical protein